jgi:hypothetical protein
MNYVVEWDQLPLDEVTVLWLAADTVGRKAITQACDTVDQQLSANPFANSESRYNNRRITFVPPLVVIYRIESDDRTVTVIDVRQIRRRKN